MTCHNCNTQFQPHRFKGEVAQDKLQDNCLTCAKELMESAKKSNMTSMWASMSYKPQLPEGTRQQRQAVMQRHKQRTSTYAKLAKQCQHMIDLIDYELRYSQTTCL